MDVKQESERGEAMSSCPAFAREDVVARGLGKRRLSEVAHRGEPRGATMGLMVSAAPADATRGPIGGQARRRLVRLGMCRVLASGMRNLGGDDRCLDRRAWCHLTPRCARAGAARVSHTIRKVCCELHHSFAAVSASAHARAQFPGGTGLRPALTLTNVSRSRYTYWRRHTLPQDTVGEFRAGWTIERLGRQNRL